MIFDYPRYYQIVQTVSHQNLCNRVASTFYISRGEERSKLHEYVRDIRKKAMNLMNYQSQRIFLVGDAESIINCIYNEFEVTDMFRLGLTIVDSESCTIGSSIPVDVSSVDLYDLSFSMNSIHTFPALHCLNLRELHFGAHCCDNSPSLFLSCLETPNLRRLVFESASFCETTSCVIRNLPLLTTIVVGESAFSPALFDDYLHLPEREKASLIGCHSGLFLLDNLPRLATLLVASGCFLAYHRLVLRGLPLLASLATGSSCFAGVRSATFDLPALTSIDLGSGSFRFATELRLVAPSLVSFGVGRFCFHDVATACFDDLHSLQTIQIGYKAFEMTRRARVSNCPSLLYLKIDKCCFVNAESLVLENLDELKTVEILNYSFSNTYRLSMKQLPRLSYLRLDGNSKTACFSNTECIELKDVAHPNFLEIHNACFKKKGAGFFLGALS